MHHLLLVMFRVRHTTHWLPLAWLADSTATRMRRFLVCSWFTMLLVICNLFEVIDSAPGHTTRDGVQGGDDPDCYESADGPWTYYGNTLDGRPSWTKYVEYKKFGITLGGADVYMYYDSNCDGKTGPERSANGHPLVYHNH